MAKFEEALMAMRAGKIIGRPSSFKKYELKGRTIKSFFYTVGGTKDYRDEEVIFNSNDIMAEDWVVQE